MSNELGRTPGEINGFCLCNRLFRNKRKAVLVQFPSLTFPLGIMSLESRDFIFLSQVPGPPELGRKLRHTALEVEVILKMIAGRSGSRL